MLRNCIYCIYFLDEEFGLYYADDDPKKCVWLKYDKPLEFYSLKSGVRLLNCLYVVRVESFETLGTGVGCIWGGYESFSEDNWGCETV